MRPKIQHYVPQFYLRNFADKRKKGHFVYCYEKSSKKIFNPNVKNVASESGFYDFYSSDGQKYSIEELISGLEAKSHVALENLSKDPTHEALVENKEILSYFFAFQESRTAVFRAEYSNMIQVANNKLKGDGVFFQTPSENESKEFQAKFLLDSTPLFAKTMFDMKWILILNKTGIPFWTSDNPIIRYNPHKSDLIGNLGLQSQGIQLHIPLNPDLALIICDPFGYRHMESVKVAIPPNVDFNNSRQVLYSRQYIFSIKNEFQLAKEMIKKYPELGNPNRSRIIAN